MLHTRLPSLLRCIAIVVIDAVTGEVSEPIEACLCVRIKSTLAKRGVHIKSAGYRVRSRYRFATDRLTDSHRLLLIIRYSAFALQNSLAVLTSLLSTAVLT